jgi:phage FluMu gp28-like protein
MINFLQFSTQCVNVTPEFPKKHVNAGDVLRVTAERSAFSIPENPMTAKTPAIQLPATVKPFVPLLPYQQEDVEADDRFRWACWARQTGKSFTKSLRRLLRGLKRQRNQIFLSAGERQSRELMTKTRQHLAALNIAHQFKGDAFFEKTSLKQLEITLPNHVRIIGLPANPATARGFTGDVFLDEFAMHADDRDIWAAMFPTLVRGGGEMDVASTPKGKNNTFYRLRNTPRFTHSTLTILSAKDQGLDIDLDALKEGMADELLYRQEFLCEFVDEAYALLTYEQIAKCENQTLTGELDWAALIDWPRPLFIGVDVGRKRDLTVIWILDRIDDVYCTRAVVEMAHAPFRVQAAMLADLLALPQARHCCIDAGGIGMQLAEQIAERFGRHRVSEMTLTNTRKAELAGRLRILVEDAKIQIPVDEAIRNDWHSVERSVTASGLLRLDAKRSADGHADRFWAAALAVRAAEGDVGKPEYLPGPKLRFATERNSSSKGGPSFQGWGRDSFTSQFDCVDIPKSMSTVVTVG